MGLAPASRKALTNGGDRRFQPRAFPAAFGALAFCEPLLQPSVPRRIIDIAASSVAHYGPVEVLRPPVGRPADETAEATDGFYHFLIRR